MIRALGRNSSRYMQPIIMERDYVGERFLICINKTWKTSRNVQSSSHCYYFLIIKFIVTVKDIINIEVAESMKS